MASRILKSMVAMLLFAAANLCLNTIGEVSRFARNRLKSMQRRPRLITAFWQQAELPI